MAKTAKAKPDEARVATHVSRLVAAKLNKPLFETIVGDLEDRSDVTAADLIAIAHRYNKGGKKPTSKAAALAMIRKRFVELIRTANKNKVAEKARPW